MNGLVGFGYEIPLLIRHLHSPQHESGDHKEAHSPPYLRSHLFTPPPLVQNLRASAPSPFQSPPPKSSSKIAAVHSQLLAANFYLNSAPSAP